jgi:hypothetical protein
MTADSENQWTATIEPFLIAKEPLSHGQFYGVVPGALSPVSGWGRVRIPHPRFPENECRAFCDLTSLTFPARCQWEALRHVSEPEPLIWLQYDDSIFASPAEASEWSHEVVDGEVQFVFPERQVIEFCPAYWPLPPGL